jgi:hypothetical protein
MKVGLVLSCIAMVGAVACAQPAPKPSPDPSPVPTAVSVTKAPSPRATTVPQGTPVPVSDCDHLTRFAAPGSFACLDYNTGVPAPCSAKPCPPQSVKAKIKGKK